jgi:hypothetical protein
MRSVHGSSSVRGAARETAVAPLICREETFLCAEKSVALEIAWHRRIGAEFFGGQGFILQKVSGPSTVFLDLSGEIVERDTAVVQRPLARHVFPDGPQQKRVGGIATTRGKAMRGGNEASSVPVTEETVALLIENFYARVRRDIERWLTAPMVQQDGSMESRITTSPISTHRTSPLGVGVSSEDLIVGV